MIIREYLYCLKCFNVACKTSVLITRLSQVMPELHAYLYLYIYIYIYIKSEEAISAMKPDIAVAPWRQLQKSEMVTQQKERKTFA